MPAVLLDRRPDLKAAINKLEASGYRLAQSKRELFPAISLTGSLGTSTSDLKEILNGDYSIWSLASNLTMPIFNGKRLRANIAINKSQLSIDELNLVKKMLFAFSEVEQALLIESSMNIQHKSMVDAEKQSKAAYELSMDRYINGVTDLITVLNSQKQWFDSKSQNYALMYNKIQARTVLYKVIGGDFVTKKNEGNK